MVLSKVFKTFGACNAYLFLYLLSVADENGIIQKTPEEICSESRYNSERINSFLAKFPNKVRWDGKHLRIQNKKEFDVLTTGLFKEKESDVTSYDNFVLFYNETLKLNGSRIKPLRFLRAERRRKALKKVMNDYGADIVKEVVVKAATSPFLNSVWLRPDGDPAADFDWIMNPINFEKILHGKYSNS